MGHIDGARSAVALWIVCHHMAPRDPPSGLDPFAMRVDVGVEFFVLLSGFLTHYHYGEQVIESKGDLARYYVRRLGRTVLITQFAMCLCVFLNWCGGFAVLTWKTAGCLLFVKSWVDPTPNCPNMPTWFVAAMLPSWLLYPVVLQRVLAAVRTSLSRLLALTLGFWLFAIGPQLLLIARHGAWLTWDQILSTWFWPPAQLADFALGACTAALVRRAPPSRLAAVLGDVAIVSLMLACLLVPVPPKPDSWAGPAAWRPGHYMGWDQLSGRLSAPLLMAFLYGSAGPGSLVARYLSHVTPVSLGAYTLEVYLFQMPLHDVFLWLRPPSGRIWRGLYWNNEVFFFYLMLLWIISGLFAEFAAEPLAKWLRNATATSAGRAPPPSQQDDAFRLDPRGGVAAETLRTLPTAGIE